MTEIERTEVTTWEESLDRVRRTTSDRTIGSTFVALAKYDNDEPNGLQECRIKKEKFMSDKGVVNDEAKEDERKDDAIQKA